MNDIYKIILWGTDGVLRVRFTRKKTVRIMAITLVRSSLINYETISNTSIRIVIYHFISIITFNFF